MAAQAADNVISDIIKKESPALGMGGEGACRALKSQLGGWLVHILFYNVSEYFSTHEQC